MIIVCAVLEAVLDVIWHSFGRHFGISDRPLADTTVRAGAALTTSRSRPKPKWGTTDFAGGSMAASW